jgi:hypothetical protein
MRYLFIALGCAAIIGLIKYWIPMIDAIISFLEKAWKKMTRQKK